MCWSVIMGYLSPGYTGPIQRPSERDHQAVLCKAHLSVLILTHWDWVTHTCVSKLSSLVQIMARRLFIAKPLFEPMIMYCQYDPNDYISMKYHLKFTNVFIQENAFENIVCKVQPFCVCLYVLNNDLWLMCIFYNTRYFWNIQNIFQFDR